MKSHLTPLGKKSQFPPKRGQKGPKTTPFKPSFKVSGVLAPPGSSVQFLQFNYCPPKSPKTSLCPTLWDLAPPQNFNLLKFCGIYQETPKTPILAPFKVPKKGQKAVPCEKSQKKLLAR